MQIPTTPNINTFQLYFKTYYEFIAKISTQISSDEQKQLSLDFPRKKPDLIEIFWMDFPLNLQILVLYDLETSKPNSTEIIVHGPFQNYDFFKKIESILEEEERWQETFEMNYTGDPPHKEKYADYFKIILQGEIKQIKKNLFGTPKHYFSLSDNGRGGNRIYYRIYGNILDIEYKTQLNAQLKQIIFKRSDIKKEIQSSNQNTIQINLKTENNLEFGTHFIPKLEIGKKKPIELVKDAIDHPERPKIVVSGLIENKILNFYDDGFVTLQTNEKMEGFEILNLIFTIAYLSDLYCIRCNSNEIIKISRATDGSSSETTYPGSHTLRAEIDLYRRIPKTDSWRERYIDEEFFKLLIKNVDQVLSTQNKSLLNYLRTFFITINYWHSEEYNDAFINGWFLIEQYYSEIFRNYQVSKNTDPPLIQHFEKQGFGKKIKLMNNLNIISDETKKILDQIRTKRNLIIHPQESAEPEITRILLNHLLVIILLELKKAKITLPSSLLNFMEPQSFTFYQQTISHLKKT